jgi:hypothetical protein
MGDETISTEEADLEAIICKSFEGCKEPGDYVAAAKLPMLKELKTNKELHKHLGEIGEHATEASIERTRRGSL